MAGEIRVDLVADASRFEAAMKKADQAAGKFEKTNKDLGESFDDTKKQALGTADLLDGLATTMGFNVDGAIGMARGFADLADGISTTLIPALKNGAKSATAMSKALLATPWGRIAAGVVLVGTAMAVASKDTDAFGRAVAGTKDAIDKSVEGWRGMFNSAAGALGVTSQATLDYEAHLRKTSFTAVELQFAVETMASRAAGATATLGSEAQRTYNEYQNLLDIMHEVSSVGAGTNASASDWFSGGGAMGSGGDSRSFEEVMGDIASDKARAVTARTRSVAKATKNVETAVKKVADAAAKAFEKVKPQLEAASQKFADSTTIRDNIKAGFGLDFGDDLGHDVVEGLRRQVKRFEDFIRGIARLRKLGLRESVVQQFVEAGPGSLDELNRINSGNFKEINRLAKSAEKQSNAFGSAEAMRQTGVDPNKPVKVVIDVKGGDSDLKNLIKKWVRTDGGGSVQVAFR